MIKEDFHLHSNFSDGENSLEEMTKKAIDLRYRKIAFTDHVRSETDWLGIYIKEIKRLIPIPKRNTITLTLAASKNSWMKVILDGETTFHKTLSKNSKETWKAKNEIRLAEIGKPEALKLNVNGKNIDLSGKRLSRNILITHKGVDLGPR